MIGEPPVLELHHQLGQPSRARGRVEHVEVVRPDPTTLDLFHDLARPRCGVFELGHEQVRPQGEPLGNEAVEDGANRLAADRLLGDQPDRLAAVEQVSDLPLPGPGSEADHGKTGLLGTDEDGVDIGPIGQLHPQPLPREEPRLDQGPRDPSRAFLVLGPGHPALALLEGDGVRTPSGVLADDVGQAPCPPEPASSVEIDPSPVHPDHPGMGRGTGHGADRPLTADPRTAPMVFGEEQEETSPEPPTLGRCPPAPLISGGDGHGREIGSRPNREPSTQRRSRPASG